MCVCVREREGESKREGERWGEYVKYAASTLCNAL